jgi:hypothetical protein
MIAAVDPGAARHAPLLLWLGRALREMGDPAAGRHLPEAWDAFQRFGWGPAADAAERHTHEAPSAAP